MVKYVRYFETREEYNKAVLEAIDKVGKEATKSKEAAHAFLVRAGIIQDDKTEEKDTSNNKF